MKRSRKIRIVKCFFFPQVALKTASLVELLAGPRQQLESVDIY